MRGQTLNAQTSPEYQALYEAIGNLYGGSSNQDFVVPDLRGRVIAGADNMGGTHANRITSASIGAAAVLAATGGAQTHTLTVAQMPSHNHTLNKPAWRTSERTSGSQFWSPDLGPYAGNNDSGVIQNTGGGQAHNNVQPTIIMNKIIKY